VPYKSVKLKISGTPADRRIKLNEEDKIKIRHRHVLGISIRAISREFAVNRRLIQFILFPERQKKNVEDRKLRGGWKQYYQKDRHAEAIKEHRRYKQSLYLKEKS